MAKAFKMSLPEVMEQLEAMGTEQNRKVYARHGASENMFGVSFANLYAMQKKIKKDHDLALALWETGNVDARCLATMVADPEVFTISQAEKWVEECTDYGSASLIAAVAAKAPWSNEARQHWMDSDGEFVQQAGWAMVSFAMRDAPDSLSDAEGAALLERIERDIHHAPNRARGSMNSALIALGSEKPALTQLAIEAAGRIGKVFVEHGETGCKTPDAIPYIEKTLARKKARQ